MFVFETVCCEPIHESRIGRLVLSMFVPVTAFNRPTSTCEDNSHEVDAINYRANTSTPASVSKLATVKHDIGPS